MTETFQLTTSSDMHQLFDNISHLFYEIIFNKLERSTTCVF